MIGEYRAYYGHNLELKDDATFRYESRFDLASSWAVGQTKVSNRMVYLNLKNVYDTLTMEGKSDVLILSSDEKSNRIKIDEFVIDKSAAADKADELIE